MTLENLSARAPILLIHGGAGSREPKPDLIPIKRDSIRAVTVAVWAELQKGISALEAVSLAVGKLEDDRNFNAGTGSCLQFDGLCRLSASLMDGSKQRFSAVSNATHIANPSRLASALQLKKHTVLSDIGAQLLARELGIPPEDPATAEKILNWLEVRSKKSAETNHGTVGAIALDSSGRLAAATSTGGSNADCLPGRVSDVPTVAGNYASAFAAISCTGVGEQIVNDAVAARIETRVRDGHDIVNASERQLSEARASQHQYGWIALDASSNWAIRYSTEQMYAAAMSAERKEPLVV